MNAQTLAGMLGDGATLDLPLGPWTVYGVGGSASVAFALRTPRDLERLADVIPRWTDDILVIGRGTNILIADDGFKGLVVMVQLNEIVVDDIATGARVTAAAGTSLPVLARRTASLGLTGLEWAVGVPGSVGGAVRLNSGGHGSDVAASLVHAEVLDLRTGHFATLPAQELGLGYRRSVLGPTDLVTRATFSLAYGNPDASQEEIATVVRWRREYQPSGRGGLAFKNPDGDSAGRLIDAAGARGLRHGTAYVSERHANFILADPNGQSADVYRLIRRVQEVVKNKLGVELDVEPTLVGFQPTGDKKDRRRAVPEPPPLDEGPDVSGLPELSERPTLPLAPGPVRAALGFFIEPLQMVWRDRYEAQWQDTFSASVISRTLAQIDLELRDEVGLNHKVLRALTERLFEELFLSEDGQRLANEFGGDLGATLLTAVSELIEAIPVFDHVSRREVVDKADDLLEEIGPPPDVPSASDRDTPAPPFGKEFRKLLPSAAAKWLEPAGVVILVGGAAAAEARWHALTAIGTLILRLVQSLPV